MISDFSKAGYIPLNSGEKFYIALNEVDSMPTDVCFYHYTTTSVLNAVLKSATFRATNIFYLNDYKEYISGVAHLKDVFQGDATILSYLEEIEKLNAMSRGGVYSISFSGDDDELQQWITYAKESGVRIEFDPMVIWNSGSRLRIGEKTNTESDCIISSPCFRNLIYIDKEKKEDGQAQAYKEKFAKYILEAKEARLSSTPFIDNDIEIQRCWDTYSDEAKAFLMLIASYYKERSFGGENEIRAVFLPFYNRKNNGAKISFFEQPNGVLRPYIDIKFYHSYRHGTFKLEIPFKSIKVGPGREQEKVYHSIIHRIENGDVNTWKYSCKELQKKYQNYLDSYYSKAGIDKASAKMGPTLWFLKRISQDVDFDIYYHKNTYQILCGSLPKDISSKSYILFDNKTSIDMPKEFIQYQEKEYMTAQGILISKSEIPYLY